MSLDRHPDWQVTSVFDPEGEGHDFAYTVGLHDRGLPELHIWGRPSLGEDPGADWMFSPGDRTRILNELAWRLIDCSLHVGDTWEERYDGGQATARFRLDPPGDRDELEAFGIAPDAVVLPVRWSLHRPPVGRPRALTKRAHQRATAEYAALLDALPPEAAVPPGWSLPPAFVPGGELGPLTPMAAGRVAEFWAADAIQLSNLLWTGGSIQTGGSVTWPATVAAAVAREAGRVDEMARAKDAAIEVVQLRLERADWPQTLRELHAAIGFQPGEVTLEQLERAVPHQFSDLLWAVLTTEVVADRLTSAQRVQGRGAWLSGLGPLGELPGRQWRAPRPVIDRVYALLRPLGFFELLTLSRRQDDLEATDHQRVAERVRGWAFVSAAGCPWQGVLDRLPGLRAFGRPIVPMTALQEWATVMTSAVCHRERLSSADVATLCAPFLDVVPELPGLFGG